MRLSFVITTFFASSLSYPLIRDNVLPHRSDIVVKETIEALTSRSPSPVACIHNHTESGTRCTVVSEQAGTSQADPDNHNANPSNRMVKASKSKMGTPKVQTGSTTDAQRSLALDPAVIAKGFEQDGLSKSEPGVVASLTSTNNFINFCNTVKLPITNGRQVKGGSCNPAPMGVIPSTKNIPSSKFVFPKNGDTLKAKKTFKIQMAVKNLVTGNFVNAETNYFAAPQQLDDRGMIIGHSHVVIEQLTSLDQTTPTDPKKFAFFKGLNDKAQKGVLAADVVGGLPAGSYRLSSINTAANHQPVLVPIAQHGALDDTVYFIVR